MAQGRAGGVGIAGLQSIRTIKASGLESDFFSRWAGFFANMYNSKQELSVVNYYLGVVPPLLFALMTASVLLVGGFEVMHGRMSIGMLVAFQSLAASFLQPVNSLVGLGASVQALGGDLSRLDDVLSSPAPNEPSLDSVPEMPVRLRGHVEFRNVTFGYSPVAPPLISNLSFHVHPGQRIAFVGGSGSGKSTVVRLLAGLYSPLSGEILFDGIPASSIPREILANSMAMVDQDILLFKGSVRDNSDAVGRHHAEGQSLACLPGCPDRKRHRRSARRLCQRIARRRRQSQRRPAPASGNRARACRPTPPSSSWTKPPARSIRKPN